MKDLTGLRTEEDLDIYLQNYNWDDGFDIPAAILQKECCTLQVALQIFGLHGNVKERKMTFSYRNVTMLEIKCEKYVLADCRVAED